MIDQLLNRLPPMIKTLIVGIIPTDQKKALDQLLEVLIRDLANRRDQHLADTLIKVCDVMKFDLSKYKDEEIKIDSERI